jgi:hypothetical protein
MEEYGSQERAEDCGDVCAFHALVSVNGLRWDVPVLCG